MKSLAIFLAATLPLQAHALGDESQQRRIALESRKSLSGRTVKAKSMRPRHDGKAQKDTTSKKQNPKFQASSGKPNRDKCSKPLHRIQDQQDSLDYSTILSDNDGVAKWTDDSFTFPRSIAWSDLPQIADYQIAGDRETVDWLRLSDDAAFADFSMWGSEERVAPNDIVQGGLGDCWFMSSAASYAEVPARIKRVFLTEELNQKGVYAVQFYVLGSPVTVTIDDYLPYDSLSYPSSFKYSYESSGDAVWVPLLEKAAAKLFGNYEAINGGFEINAFEMLHGGPTALYYLSDGYTSDEIWQILSDEDNQKSFMTVGSFAGQYTDEYENHVGIPYAHAFSVLGTQTVQVSESVQARLVKMRNPWSQEYYFGPWSDSSAKWNDELLAQADHTPLDDGEYYIPVEDFIDYFESITVGKDVTGWQRSNYDVYADDDSHDPAYIWSNDWTVYNTYEFTLTSPVEQEVYISLHTYTDQQYLSTCYGTYMYSEVLLESATHDEIWYANPGAAHLAKITMSAGEEIDVSVYTNFSRKDLLPHDWNLVVLASDEAMDISLTNAQIPRQLQLSSDNNLEVAEQSQSQTLMTGAVGITSVTAAFALLFCYCTRKGKQTEDYTRA